VIPYAHCTKIVTCVWEEEVVPEEWHQGIIITLYKGKGSKSECSSYRGITLLCMPGKMFAHIILARIKPTLLSHRRPQQSRFTPGRSTCDRIATLCNMHNGGRISAIQLLQQTHCYNPVASTYPVWHIMHMDDNGLEKTTRSSSYHVAQQRPIGSETTPPYAPQSSRFGSEPPSVNAWRYTILELRARNDDDDSHSVMLFNWRCRQSLGVQKCWQEY